VLDVAVFILYSYTFMVTTYCKSIMELWFAFNLVHETAQCGGRAVVLVPIFA
jgi:hypothetical protein